MRIISTLKKYAQSLSYFYPFYGYHPSINKPNKIFIYGCYGVGNLGDEIILESILFCIRIEYEYISC
jgi:hypothetical protein